MRNDIRELYRIQDVLKKVGYYDISRISKEVLDYVKVKKIPLDNVLNKIEEGEPWEYICKKTIFRNNTFYINENVLIPRIETEQIINIAKENLNGIKNIVDIGTGSGCIIISLQKELGDKFNYIGIDISEKAIKIAKKNDISRKIKFIHGDLLKDINLDAPTLYIANLPYIPQGMYENLDKSVKDYEPKIALLGGNDGLLYYKKVFKQITDERSRLIIEVEPSIIPNIKRIARNFDLEIYKDIYDKERFIRLIPSLQV